MLIIHEQMLDQSGNCGMVVHKGKINTLMVDACFAVKSARSVNPSRDATV